MNGAVIRRSNLEATDAQKLARVRILRCDPSSGKGAYYQEFEDVPFEARNVLDVLRTLYEEHDSTLAFRRFCTKGFCGSCLMLVNGSPVLACQHPAGPEMTIEPHPRFPVIRDLVVDLEHPLDAGNERPEETPTKQAVVSEAKITHFGPQIDQARCVHCQDCVAICPARVYQFAGKRVQVSHPDSCLGPSCNVCVDSCWKKAISLLQP